MPIDSSPKGAFSSPDPGYLLRLRERALARMRQDEMAVGVAVPDVTRLATLSRRASLRMLGLAVAGAVTGELSARAAGIASLRSAAPQYGAPTWPGPGVGYEAPPPSQTYGNNIPMVGDRKALSQPSTWTKDSLLVLPADGQKYTGYRLARLDAKVIYFASTVGRPHALDAVVDPVSGNTYIVPGGQTFYVRTENDLLGFLFGPTTLSIRRPLFQTKTNEGRVDDAIHQFTSTVSDRTLAAAAGSVMEIPLGTTLARDSWSYSPGWMPALRSVSATDHVLEFEVGYGDSPMRVDWRVGKLLPPDPK